MITYVDLQRLNLINHYFFYVIYCFAYVSGAGSFLKDFIFAINAFASGSVSKCLLTGSINSLMTGATAGFKSFWCNFPSLKWLASYSYDLNNLNKINKLHVASIFRLSWHKKLCSHTKYYISAIINNRVSFNYFLRTKSFLNFLFNIFNWILHKYSWVRITFWHFLLALN